MKLIQKRVIASVLVLLAGSARARAALPAFSNDQAASLVVGQLGMTSNAGAVSSTALNGPQSACTAGTKLIVADTPNNRVLIYNHIPASNDVAADVVIGQADMNSNSANQGGSAAAANTLSSPQGVYSDGTKLYISDSGNNRVLIFNAIPTADNTSADVAVGQANKTSNSVNQGGSAAANTLQAPAGLYSDGTKLYIADTGNGRVLIYDAIPASDGASSDLALTLEQNSGSMSQPRAIYSDGTKLYVSDPNNLAFLIYNSTPSTNVAPDVQLSTAVFGAYSDGTKLYLADANNSRILIYNSIPAANTATPDGVLGQADLTGILPNQGGASPSANTLSAPDGIYADGTRLYVADTSNNRVLVYGPTPATLVSPANSTYVGTTAPVLAWSTSTPDSSEIQLATDAGFAGVIADTITTNAFYVSTNTLTNGANYWWRVGIAGGSWSAPYSFTVDVAPPVYSAPQVSTFPTSGSWTNLNANAYISTSAVSAKISVQDVLSGLLVSTSLPAGLVAQWHLDEPSGTAVLDASTNSFNGNVVNGATRTPGKVGGSLNLNGSQQYVSLSTMNVNYSNGFSAEAWVYYNGFNSWSRIFDFGNGEFSDNIVFANNSTSTFLTFQVYTGLTPGNAVSAPFALTTGQWIHLAVTESASGAVVIYRNGVAVSTGTTSVPNSINRTSNFLGRSNFPNDGYLNGALDEVRIFNVPLSSAQILADYQEDTSNAENRGQAYNVLYSTTAGASWNFVSTQSVTLGGANGTTGGQTLEADNIPVVVSAGPGAATNQVAFVASDFAGNVSTAVYTVLVSAPPGVPTVGAVTASSISVTWTAVNSSGYELDASTAPNFSGAILSSTTANGASGGLTVTSLSPNATYYLRAGALWGATTNYASTALSTCTLFAPPPVPQPSTLSAVVVASSTIRWAWIENGGAAASFGFHTSTGGLVASLPAGTSFYMETGLSTSTAYSRYLMALNASGQAQSSTVTVVTPLPQSALTGTGSGTLLGTDGAGLQIPAALLAVGVEWIVSENPVSHPLTDKTAALIGQASPPSGLLASPASLTEFIVAVNGARFASALAQSVTVSVPYLDADGDGVVDGTGIRASTLSLYTLNENTGQWDAVPGSHVDTVNHLVVGSIGHLSIFNAFGTSAQSAQIDLSAMRVYPVPFKPNSGDPNQGVPFSPGNSSSGIVFDNMPAQATIKIYTLTGKQVIELNSTSASGALQWDARGSDGRDVASGGYIAVITSPGVAKMVKKLMVIR